MSQSSTIAFFILAGFLVYITIKGELTSYAGILGIGPKATTAPTSKAAPTPTADTPTNGGGSFMSLNPKG
jgi:hypothetical protein